MNGRNILRYTVILTALFVSSSLLGFLAPIPGNREMLGTLLNSYLPFLTLVPWKMFFAILLNNAAKTFAVLLAGILFGLVPLLAVATNGYILGVAYLFASRGVGYIQAAKTVLPHGVLEIPAIILAASYGLWLGVTFTKRIRERNLVGFGNQVMHAIRMFFLVVFPLFILVALIETVLISLM
jgi:stage II sporulation protein M